MKTQLKKRIFLVDDDPFWTAMLTAMLNDLGCTNIFHFKNGTDCINNLHLNPGLIFLDYQMGDLNGVEVLKKVKDYFPGIGVIFCTAHEDLSVAVDAMRFGSFDYLLKGNASRKEIVSILNNLASEKVETNTIF